MNTLYFPPASLAFGALLFTSALPATGERAEGQIDVFFGEPKFEMQPLFTGARLPNVVVATDGTVVASHGATGGPGDWWKKGFQVRRSEDGYIKCPGA